MIKAGLVAGDAGVDLVLAPLEGFDHEVRIGQHGPRHGDQIGVPPREHRLGHIGHVDAVAGDHRHGQLLAETTGDLSEGRAGNHGGDRRDLGLVPAEVGRDDVCAHLDHGLAKSHNLVPGHAILEHVHGGDPEDQDEVGPDGFTHAPHHLDRKAHAVLEIAAPLVSALIGALYQEGRQQVARRADDLDPVIAGQPGHGRAVGKVFELLFDSVGVQLIGNAPCDPGADRGRRDALWSPGQ